MGKKQMKYTPLTLVEQHSEAIREFEKAIAINGATDELKAATKYAVNRIYAENGLIRGQWNDSAEENMAAWQSYCYAVATIVAYHWSKCKQVYSFSYDFYKMLLDMEDFEVEGSLFDKLPYETFYLELLGHSEVDGVLIKYAKGNSRAIIYTICGKPGNRLNINSGIINLRENTSYKTLFETELYSKAYKKHPYVVMVRQVLAFVFQACMYLCAKNADIEENATQKQFYKPSTTVRNKFSEIRKWDVGVHVVREHNTIKSSNTHKTVENAETVGTDTTRRRPRQHWRKAHWHTYWIGPKNNQEKVLKFIAPILVNDNNDEMPVTVHQ